MTDWPYGEPFTFGEVSMNTRTLILERFIEMLNERGLSAHQYTELRSNHRVDHMIDIRKDGEWLARYNTAFLYCFSEGEMEEKLDKLKESIQKRQFDQEYLGKFVE